MENEILYEAYVNWRKPLSKFYWFLVSTPFASIDDISEFQIKEEVGITSNSIEAFNICKDNFENVGRDNLIIIDLNGEEALDIALLFNNNLNIKPVICFSQIYHPKGIVGNSIVLSKLINYSFRLKPSEKEIYSFIFDYSRYGNCEYDKSKFYNNQYELTEEELPLKADIYNNDIKSVIILTYKEIKEDMKAYIEYLKDNNIEVDVRHLPKNN